MTEVSLDAALAKVKPSFTLLQREGYLIRACLGTGLTSIRAANWGDKESCYLAFFQLSIGIERLAKVILIIDHMALNGLIPPSSKTVRNFGHELDTLLEAVGRLTYCASLPALVAPGTVGHELISLLSEFAEGSRYHNLDRLTAGKASPDPLAVWHAVLQKVSMEIPEHRTRRSREVAAFVGQAFGPYAGLAAHNLDGSTLGFQQGLMEGTAQRSAAPYAMRYLHAILREMYMALVSASDLAQSADHTIGNSDAAVPCMGEFLQFLNLPAGKALRKKRWP